MTILTPSDQPNSKGRAGITPNSDHQVCMFKVNHVQGDGHKAHAWQ